VGGGVEPPNTPLGTPLLNLKKNFVKAAMDRTGSAFKYLAENFPRLREAKIKEEFM
jgi:hypothetical protein